MTEFAFVAELDLERLLRELEQRGCEDVGVDVLTNDAGEARALRVSFAVRPRFEQGAQGAGHRMLSDAVRQSFTHQAVEARRLAAARARGR